MKRSIVRRWVRRLCGGLVVAGLAAGGLATPAGVARAAGGAAQPPALNLNSASQSELESLPGIGAARARAIVEAREARGGFKSVEELEEVKGIGRAQLEKLRPLVSVSPAGTKR